MHARPCGLACMCGNLAPAGAKPINGSTCAQSTHTRERARARVCVCDACRYARNVRKNACARGRVSTCRQVRRCTMQTHAGKHTHTGRQNWMHHYCPGALHDACIMFPFNEYKVSLFFWGNTDRCGMAFVRRGLMY